MKFFLVLFLSPIILYGQNSTISVIATDTVHLEVVSQSHFAQPLLDDDNIYFDDKIDKNEIDVMLRTAYDQALTFLQLGQYDYQLTSLTNELDPFYDLQDEQLPNIQVTTYSDLASASLANGLSQIKNLHYVLTGNNYKDPSTNYERILLRLLNKAERKAKIMARTLNRDLGRAIRYEELPDINSDISLSERILEMLSYRSAGMHSSIFIDNGIYEKSIRVEYEIEE